jgi:hypothetical protein
MYEINKYIDVNIGGTAGLLDYITNNKHAVKKIIVLHPGQFMEKVNIPAKNTVWYILWQENLKT